MKQRLHKILAASTELSRRSAEKAITAGEVKVNGKVIVTMGCLADVYKDDIRWKGKRIFLPREKIYIVYNKPRGKMVTKHDPEGRETIWSDLKKFRDAVNPVGRLDYDSEGLLILTNDGELINRLTHPRHEIKKIYNVKVKGFPDEDDLTRLRDGLVWRGVKYQPAQVEIRYKTENNMWLEVKISEGQNRQVRNMFEAINHPVLKLKRFAVGPVRLGKLASSEWRFLRKGEKEALLSEVGLMRRREFRGKRRTRR